MMKYRGSKLADGTLLNVAVYRAYRNAGLTHNQALAVTAEVGRENGFNSSILFGSHTDPAANRSGGVIRNVGMLSWNGNRGKNLIHYLTTQGLMGRGGMARTQENLNAQARFSVQEMKSSAYRGGLRHFWNNPNADPETFARELGRNYIVWAYGQNTIRAKGGGRVAFNWRSHDNRRRSHLGTLSGMLGDNYQPETPKQQPSLLFIGDSIAHGYRGVAKGRGNTKVGANPNYILGQIRSALSANPNVFRGQNIVLSSGLSNGDDLGSIEKQLQLLQKSNANVRLLGVSNSFNLGGRNGQAMNSALAYLASKYGAKFHGGFQAGKDNVHPLSYRGTNFDFEPQMPSYQPKTYSADEIAKMRGTKENIYQPKTYSADEIMRMRGGVSQTQSHTPKNYSADEIAKMRGLS